MMKVALLLVVAAPLLGGCGSGDTVPAHSASEQQAIDAEAKLTPEQQIEQIQKGGMPAGAKADMIARIKAEHGIK